MKSKKQGKFVILISASPFVLQVIPAENIVAAFQGHQKTVFAVSKTPSEAKNFLEV